MNGIKSKKNALLTLALVVSVASPYLYADHAKSHIPTHPASKEWVTEQLQLLAQQL